MAFKYRPAGNTALDAIGNTPVIRLTKILGPDHADVYIKLESSNPTGSYKDRMALSMIEGAERSGKLKPGMKVVEATGGSTGSSLAFVCAVKGYKFHVISSNAYAQEKLRTMAAFGAEVESIESPSGKITSDLFPKLAKRARDLAESDEYFYTDQFNNRDTLPGYAMIGQELVEQLPKGVDVFCGAVGTAGMLMGVAGELKAKWPETRIVALEPASSPILTKEHPGTHSVEGIAVGFVPPHLDKSLYDDALAIDEAEARKMCKRLAKEEGIFVGTSGGLNIAAAVRLAKELGAGKTVATVACDTGLKYLNGTLFADE